MYSEEILLILRDAQLDEFTSFTRPGRTLV